jgi:hypothetical protein
MANGSFVFLQHNTGAQRPTAGINDNLPGRMTNTG